MHEQQQRTTTSASGRSRKAEGPLARASGHQKSGGVCWGKFVLKVLALRLPSQSDQPILRHSRAHTRECRYARHPTAPRIGEYACVADYRSPLNAADGPASRNRTDLTASSWRILPSTDLSRCETKI